MKHLVLLISINCFILLPRPSLAADYAAPGLHPVQTWLDAWRDPARDSREVPVRFYAPTDLTAPAPIVIVSHGLAGSRDGYEYLGRHLASHGYVVLHVQHHGSDRELFANVGADRTQAMLAFRRAVANPANLVDRPRDISFAIDRLTQLNQSQGPLRQKLDLDKIAIAGHSFGGYTAMAVAGQTIGLGLNLREPRIKAALAMSPPALRPNPQGYQSITIPVLVMTGTLDDSPILGGTVQNRTRAYEALVACDHYLLIFTGGDHMVFSGGRQFIKPLQMPGTTGDDAKDPLFQSHIKAFALAFFQAHLQADPAAQAWLTSDTGAKATLGADGSWQHLPPTRQVAQQKDAQTATTRPMR